MLSFCIPLLFFLFLLVANLKNDLSSPPFLKKENFINKKYGKQG
jgi:hypothetical protein